MSDTTVQSAFEREVETYREAMGELQQSIAQMTDAVGEYDRARDELDAAVVSLGDHAAESRSVEVSDTPATGTGPVASD
jgi:uncharacterized protein YlxW (UPF0749 family)